MSDLNLYSVNWQDGMLLTQEHLKDQERYFENLSRWYATFGSDVYGLLGKSFSGQPALAMKHAVNGNRLRVEISRLRAITPGGHCLEIGEPGTGVIAGETEITGGTIPVFVSIDAAAKRPVGQPDPDEDVPRTPYLVAGYTVHLGQAPSIPEGEYLQVAEMVTAGSEVSLSETYIPPSLSTASHEGLAARALDLRNRVENLLSLSSRAYGAIAGAGALSEESSSLQLAFKETMYTLAYHLAASLDELTVGRSGMPPARLVVVFKKIFRVFATLLNLQPGLKYYLNEKLFIKQLSSEVSRFLAAIDAFLLTEYNHRDIGGQIKMIDDTMATLRSTLGFLAQLKSDQLGPQVVATDSLTYLGKAYRAAAGEVGHVETVGELCYLSLDMPSPTALADTVILMSKDLLSVAEWNNIQVRLGINEARGLGETDPVDVDTQAFGDKVALHPQDMLQSPAVRQVTLIFRGIRDTERLSSLGKSDLIMYFV
jgi:hypothetical protein